MKRLFWVSALSLALCTATPNTSQAFWNSPQCNQGFGWLQGKALNFMSFTHYHGPLYSYGPYNVPGYAYMYVPQPYCGSYLPAYPASYYGYANPNAERYGYSSWNGVGASLGYPTALSNSPSDYFSGAVMSGPAPAPTSTSYYGGSAPGFFPQVPPSQSR